MVCRFTCCVVASLVAAGCHTYTQVPLRATDASSGQPISGARITVVCDVDPVVWLRRPRPFSGVTSRDGTLTVRRANKVPLTLRATAPGFEDYRDWYFDSREARSDGRVEVAMRRKQLTTTTAP